MNKSSAFSSCSFENTKSMVVQSKLSRGFAKDARVKLETLKGQSVHFWSKEGGGGE